jgi:thiol:disulfide interchange protein
MGDQWSMFLVMSIHAIPTALTVVLCGVYLARSRSLDGLVMFAGAAIWLASRLANTVIISILAASMLNDMDAIVAVNRNTANVGLVGQTGLLIGFWLLIKRIKRLESGEVRSQL